MIIVGTIILVVVVAIAISVVFGADDNSCESNSADIFFDDDW